ncbi:MAG: ATP-binding protein [Deltaproteobacteria bacterium]|nr:ATP-binding protein [Deltaproteobacteria bacterium]
MELDQEKPQYSEIDASPVKPFFVSMLTRDIMLEDAILDLLDNCVDGILRSQNNPSQEKPYEGFNVEIEFNKDQFFIKDNCGGIPWSLHEHAFTMGRSADRPPDAAGTVGTYGIGMKRAIFKMGTDCLITTQSGDNCYELHISPNWIVNEKTWMLPVKESTWSEDEDGTTILIGNLHENISDRFSKESELFTKGLTRMISTHYAFIINKGFEIQINKKVVEPKPTQLLFDNRKNVKSPIRPYIYKTKTDSGVEIFLTVGFTSPIPTQDEISSEHTEKKKFSSMNAGWTVLCNDRAVLYCDRSEMTGWGEAGIPKYHTQFIAISGIVEFKSDDPSLLPTTTTKRGIEASSSLYLQVKNQMREGMKIFTSYTNQWKGNEEESKSHMDKMPLLNLEQIKNETENLDFKTLRRTLKGSQYKPHLPKPKALPPKQKKISFTRKNHEIEIIAKHLFDDKDASPAQVGEKCFEIILKEANQ